MEEFTLEKYETGEYDVITRTGRKVRILCTDRKPTASLVSIDGSPDEFPIVALVKFPDGEYIFQYTKRGRYYTNGDISVSDIFLKKKDGRRE